MKKLLLFVLMLIIVLPSVVFAGEYDQIRITGTFITSADVSGIGKIYVQYNTITGENKKKNEVYLLKENSFQQVITLDSSINDLAYIYGYGITKEDVPDRYGFLKISNKVVYNDETRVIDLVLSIDYDNMGFDGKKYRANADNTDEEIDDRKKGVKTDEDFDTPSTVGADSPVAPAPPQEVTTTKAPTTTVVGEKKTEEKKKEALHETKSYKLLVIIGIIFFGVVIIFVVITIVKMQQANKRV